MMSALIVIAACLLLALLLFDRLLPDQAARLALKLERRRSGLSLAEAAVPGFSMPYLQGGREQQETLVLVHGFGGDKDNFTRVARFLTPHYRVICPDLPGFGDASRDPAASYTMADQVLHLRAFLDQLGLEKVHMGGNSMGGFITAQFSATFPERVASLWLLDAAGTAAAQGSAILQRYLQTGEMPLLLRSEQDFTKLIRTTTHRPPFLPWSMRTTLARRAVRDYPLHSRIMQQLTASPLLETRYSTLETPCLIVWGQQDQILDPAGAYSFQALFPDNQLQMMAGIGHLPMVEAPKRSAIDYLAFRTALAGQVSEAVALGEN
ncbi:alpha/beta fold hydrolase [Collimonas fungivorans]|uniref:alpha/beta fold hydrolase n=1 Tax=Collimonas fungivorans TaxID=158899 RepID=UPI003FA3CEF8